MRIAKRALARAFDATGLNKTLFHAQRAAWKPHARAVNYHRVAAGELREFEAQLEFFARHFVSCGYDDLLALHEGRWPHDRPGILLTFDDGLRSHAEVVAPLLDRLSLVGWFFVPPGLVAASRAEATKVAELGEEQLTWEDLRGMHKRHVIGCHTMTHCRLRDGLSRTHLQREITDAKKMLEDRLGREIPNFAWVGGEEWSYSAAAAAVIREAGFKVSFMTNNALIRPGCNLFQLQRTNVEAHYPMSLVRFQISGFLDAMYWPKRRRVNRVTSGRCATTGTASLS